MQSVFFAIAQIEVEQFIEKNLNKNEYKVVASATHRSVVLPLMRDTCNFGTDGIVLLNEGMPNTTEGWILDICQGIRMEFPRMRIILMCGEHTQGDEFLTSAVQMGIYDIIYGKEINISDLFRLIETPNTYADAIKYLKQSGGRNSSTEMPEAVMKAPAAMMEQAQEKVPIKNEFIKVKPKMEEKEDTQEKKGVQTDISPDLPVPKSGLANIRVPVQLNAPSVRPSLPEPMQTKVISFVSTLFGVGCRETALTFAYLLAEKYKVLLIDYTNSFPQMLVRLNMNGSEYGIEQGINDAFDSNNPTLKEEGILPFNSTRMLSLHTFDSLSASHDLNNMGKYPLYTKLYADKKQYDYIITCYAGCDMLEQVKAVVNGSDHVCLVTNQTASGVRRMYDMLSLLDCDKNKQILVANRYLKSIHPSLHEMERVFHLSQSIGILDDWKGVLAADAKGIPYVPKMGSFRPYKELLKIVTSNRG